MLAACLLALALVGAAAGPAEAVATFPNDPGFTDVAVAQIASPTSISFTQDGRMLVTTQGGTVRVVVNGSLLPTPALTLSPAPCASGEQGLLGSAVSPTNQVFLYYTSSHNSECWNRVSRFTLGANNLLTGEVVLLDWIPTPATNHNAGDLNIGPDGKLYVSVGDGGCQLSGLGCAGSNDNARFRTHLLGKILRLNLDGTVPADNPFAGANTRRCGHPAGDTNPGSTASCSETWAWGLRNPFRFAFRADGLMHINDVGQGAREEVDVGAAGADYGWNCREGKIANPAISGGCTLPSATEPIHDYASSTGCRSITGAAFIPAGAWSPAYAGRYLFADYICGKIFLLDGTTVRDFATGLGGSSAVHMEFGPGRSLYYTTYAGGGEVRKISFGAGPPAPPADFDGDGLSDIGVFRPSNGVWYVSHSSAGTTAVTWGSPPGDVPASADFDGDDKTDRAVFRPSTGLWYLQRSTAGPVAVPWGASGDQPMPADYDGDGLADVAVYRPSTGVWYVSRSTGGTTSASWGIPGDVPSSGDFDGDGKADLAVFRPVDRHLVRPTQRRWDDHPELGRQRRRGPGRRLRRRRADRHRRLPPVHRGLVHLPQQRRGDLGELGHSGRHSVVGGLRRGRQGRPGRVPAVHRHLVRPAQRGRDHDAQLGRLRRLPHRLPAGPSVSVAPRSSSSTGPGRPTDLAA